VYEVSADAEITIECNPDDITPEYAEALTALPVNRVSMGAQTFSDDRLRFLHRRHTSGQVRTAVDLLRRNDIHNISIDLMFGFPQETIDDWQEDIRRALELDVEHLSAYCLMIEEGTVLYEMMREEGEKRKEEGEERREEELERQMYETLIDSLEAAGYEHYEISNFAREGFRSRHNSSYWNGTPYMGIGAAAHSYDVSTRYWNVSDIRQYIRRLKQGSLAIEETEEIDDITRYNDLITTALRTREGIDLSLLSAPKKDSPASGKAMPSFHRYLLENAEPHLHNGLLKEENHHIHLTRRGLFISDTIMSDLIYV
jgi:oxygen-independent coproporphyrinogen-3 oxidase